MRRLGWLVVLAAMTCHVSFAETLSPSIEKKVRAATFEVVVPKPVVDSLTYERELPLELIPFAIRNDKYIPIGTAFAIGKNRYVSAAHVLTAAMTSSYGAPLLRGQDGAIQQIGDLLHLSLREDFVVFSARGNEASILPSVEANPSIGSPIFAVGNALGEGIVIRDGLLTSETPEERDGDWKWLRFSAAASPGNSGGPLLDKRGRVVGVVLGKSENENLNYALPIGRVLAPEPASVAILDIRQSLRLPIMSATTVTRLNTTIPLPKPYGEFAQLFVSTTNDFFDSSLQEFVETNSVAIFPAGEGSRQLLTEHFFARLLRIIAQQPNGEWDALDPSNIDSGDLPTGGKLRYGQSAGWTVMDLTKPEDVSVGALFADSKLYMDLLLKALVLNRPVADQAIRIVSLGAARREEWHTDRYGRKWQLRIWPMEFLDTVVILYSLPQPGGAAAISTIVPSGLEHAVVTQLKFLSNLAYVTYSAPLKDWQAFLAEESLLPTVFGTIKMEIDLGKRFSFSSPRLRLDMDNWLQDISAQSPLGLRFSYFEEQGRVAWDVSSVALSENREDKTYVNVSRNVRPPPTASPDDQKSWSDLIRRSGQYSGRPNYFDQTTWVETAVGKGSAAWDPAAPEPPYVYSVAYSVAGYFPPAEMKATYQRALKWVTIFE